MAWDMILSQFNPSPILILYSDLFQAIFQDTSPREFCMDFALLAAFLFDFLFDPEGGGSTLSETSVNFSRCYIPEDIVLFNLWLILFLTLVFEVEASASLSRPNVHFVSCLLLTSVFKSLKLSLHNNKNCFISQVMPISFRQELCTRLSQEFHF
jgi:hypothetical protein